MTDKAHAAMQDCDFVLLKCPSCGAAEPIETAVMAAGTQIVVCRRCGETWPARRQAEPGADSIRKAEEAGRSLVWSDARLVDAVRRPLVSYDNGSENAWAARIAADCAPPSARSPAGQAFITAVAVLASIVFLAAFVAGRESAVAAVPDLAGLYERIGLPVNLQGLAIDGLAGERRMTGEGARLTVSGSLVNLKDSEQPVPGLVVELRDSALQAVRSVAIAPPVTHLAGQESAPFRLVIDDVPKTAIDVAVRFAVSGRPGYEATGVGAALAAGERPPQQ